MIIQPKSSDIKGSHKYLSLVLAFVVGFISTYVLCIFGPMFLFSKGNRDTGAEAMMFIFENQPVIIAIALVVGLVFTFLQHGRKSKKQLVAQIAFDDQERIITLLLVNFFSEKTETIRVHYDTLKIVVEREPDSFDTNILFIHENKRVANISNTDYIWEKEALSIKALLSKLRTSIPGYSQSKKPSGTSIPERIFKK